MVVLVLLLLRATATATATAAIDATDGGATEVCGTWVRCAAGAAATKGRVVVVVTLSALETVGWAAVMIERATAATACAAAWTGGDA